MPEHTTVPMLALTDTIEACADALLTACAAALYPNQNINDIKKLANASIDTVIRREAREGAKPR